MIRSVIRAKGLGKRYRIGARARHTGLRNVIGDTLRAPLRMLLALKNRSKDGQDASSANSSDGPEAVVGTNSISNGSAKQNESCFMWALKDVDFEIRQGEVVGLIGRNGAGKSTLLKILARITRPTEGYAEIRGRVGSLLEVGTGFHAELTGRENVYMSGAILGMRKVEIDRKFDEIVAFSEVERFLETPLKHYSSGMQMRLAFAVAAHLDPEILFIDEVLAVGDAAFQKKCLGKMSEVASHGRTILFVSHNVAAVSRLCTRCILLGSGTVLKDGPTYEVMNSYMRAGLATPAARFWNLQSAPGDGVVCLRAVRVRTAEDREGETFNIRDPIGIDVVFDVTKEGAVLTPNLHIFNEEGVNAFVSLEADPAWHGRARPKGRYISTAWIPGNFLAEGTFFVGVAITSLASMSVHLYERDAIAFQVIDSTTGDSARGAFTGHLPGIVRPLLFWETLYEPNPTDHNSAGNTGTGEIAFP